MTTRKLYLELENCIGCRACLAACTQCGGHEEKNRNYVYDVDPFVSTQTMPLMCLHCVDPACARSCPAQAIQIHETGAVLRSEEHTSELQSRSQLVCRLLPEKK